jgi:hypothetical protein
MRRPGRAVIRITPSGIATRISMRFERPTVSIQNGRPIWRLISSERASSRIEKKGRGPEDGIFAPFRMSRSRLRRLPAIRVRVSASLSCG